MRSYQFQQKCCTILEQDEKKPPDLTSVEGALPRGSMGAAYLSALREVRLEALRASKPQFADCETIMLVKNTLDGLGVHSSGTVGLFLGFISPQRKLYIYMAPDDA